MAALTYIYFDYATSTTALQTTTTATNSVGANKILVAVAQNVTSGKKAEFQAFGGKGGIGKLITADNITAGTITGNEIAANTIAAGNITVSQLSAISADLGTITAGTITGSTIQTASSGYRSVMNSSNGFQLYNGTTWKGTLKADSASSVILNSADNIYFQTNGNQMMHLTNDSMDFPSGYTVVWAGGSTLSEGGSYIKSNTNFRADSYEAKGGGSTYYTGIDDDFYYVEDIELNSSDGYIVGGRQKLRRMKIKGGIVYSNGAGAWEDIDEV